MRPKPQRYKAADLPHATLRTGATAACWECKQEYRVIDNDRVYIAKGASAWVYDATRCPLCNGNMSLYDTPEQLAASKQRTAARKLIEESEADRLHAENAGLSVRLKDALQQIALLQAELRRSEAYAAVLKTMMDDMRQQAITFQQRGDTCRQCGKPITQPHTGRQAVFCSNLCRLHYHREMKRNETKQGRLS